MSSMLFIGFICIFLVAASAAPQQKKGEDPKTYLRKFGYFDNLPASAVGGEAGEEMKTQFALEKFQKFAGIPVTGKLDGETKKKMLAPRCGDSDAKQQGAFVSKWRKNALTYQIKNYSPDLKREQVEDSIKRAFDMWEAATPLKFQKVNANAKADIVITFGKMDHGDGYNFDGEGGVLAHAFYPSDGRLHFDEDEVWSYKSPDGTDLMWVAVHELGHNLGLDHSDVQGSIMYPYYQGYHPDMKLHEHDKSRIQAIYGNENGKGGMTTTPSTPATTTTPKDCKDNNKGCKSWADAGYCNNKDYAYFMEPNCRKTCGICRESATTPAGDGCKDKRNDCDYYVKKGYCESHEQMKDVCKKSCKFC